MEMTIENVSQVEDVIWRRIGDDIVVISNDGLATHILNKTAAFIWELCDGKHGIDDMAGSLYDHFDVPEEEAKADVREIIEKLLQLGILEQNREKADS